MRGGGRRGGGVGRSESRSPAASSAAISSDDLAKLDPARLLLDEAKSLKLEDYQKRALDSITKRYDWNVRIFAHQVDSLLSAKRRLVAADSDGYRRSLRDVLQEIRDEFTGALSQALDRLDEEQRSAATNSILAEKDKLEELLKKAR